MEREVRRRPKSVETRARIANAARKQFASLGYDQTTIRSVAQEAQIDKSLVMRYFGTKEGLFSEVATFELRLPDLKGFSSAKIGEAMIRHFIDRWEGPDAKGELPALLRVASTNAVAARRLEEIFKAQIVPLAQKAGPDETAEARAALVATQMLGLAYGRYVVALPAITELDTDVIIANIGPTLTRYLNGK